MQEWYVYGIRSQAFQASELIDLFAFRKSEDDENP